jgi:predicted NAD-dependent protein-ADP-ribosyltransferase YbiA (DUF1768 family)
MEIGSKHGYPASSLSNFAPHPFVLDGVEVASMEGFLQSLKCPYPDVQKEICKLVGLAAKRRGKGYKWQKTGKLHWQGKEYDRLGDEYQELLNHAYSQLYKQSESFKNALRATGAAVLKHSIGRSKESETILTRAEFCGRLTKMRDFLMAKENPGKS